MQNKSLNLLGLENRVADENIVAENWPKDIGPERLGLNNITENSLGRVEVNPFVTELEARRISSPFVRTLTGASDKVEKLEVEIERTSNSRDLSSIDSLREEIESDDPFNLYPIIIEKEYKSKLNSRRTGGSRLGKKKKKATVVEKNSAGKEDEAKGEVSGSGAKRKLKRGRKLKSVIGEDIGKVVLEGGIFPSNSEIRACNRLLVRMEEVDAAHTWKQSFKMGLLSGENKEKDTQRLSEWDNRDAGVGGEETNCVVKEKQTVINADN